MRFVMITFPAGAKVSSHYLINPNHLTLATYVVEEHLSRKDINAAMQQAIKNATPVAAGLLSLCNAHLQQIRI